MATARLKSAVLVSVGRARESTPIVVEILICPDPSVDCCSYLR